MRKIAISTEYLNLKKNQKENYLRDRAYQSLRDAKIPNVYFNQDDIYSSKVLSFPWNENIQIKAELKDEYGNLVTNPEETFGDTGITFSVHRKRPFYLTKFKNDFVELDSIYLKDPYKNKGIGGGSLSGVENFAKNIDVNRVELIPDQEGAFVWGKKKYGYTIVPGQDLKKINTSYRRYAKKNNLPMINSNKLHDYPDDFIKQYFDKNWLPLRLEKQIEVPNNTKIADIIDMMYMEKTALNAQKARAMAQEAGLFPEGQWRWALRNLRDSRGNLLQGRAMSDRKRNLGSMNNNSYQSLKSLERSKGAGTYHPGEEDAAKLVGAASPKDSYQGTEIGGRIFRGNKLTGNNFSERGTMAETGFGDNGAATIPSDSRVGQIMTHAVHSFHTHPTTGNIAVVNQLKNSNAKVKLLFNERLIDEKQFSNTISTNEKRIKRFDLKKKRNPLLTQPSGEALVQNGQLMTTGGDMGLYLTRANMEGGEGTLNSILSPSVDIEGIHKVNNIGRTRSVYFDRSPRKSR